MSMAYETVGRTRQKQRTREALLDSARDLLAHGLTPTVEDTAAAADISRTTAYRYFPNQAALLAAAHPEIEALSMLPDNPPEDPAARLDFVIERFTAMVLESETQQRATLRVSLEVDPERARDATSLPLRQGRAIRWFTEALEPLRGTLTDDELHRLVLAVRSATGIEALVWLTDVAGLSSEEAVRLMRWSARAMLHAATCDAGPEVLR